MDEDRKANFIKIIFELWPPSDSENAHLLEPLFCHNVSLLRRVV
jgi:hypothetical protein